MKVIYKFIVAFAAVCMLFFSIGANAGNPFISGKPKQQPKEIKEQISKEEDEVSKAKKGFIKKISEKQMKMRMYISKKLEEYKENGSFSMLIIIITASFLYGILHAAGPGHGKSLASAYFLSQKEKIIKAIYLGGLIALFHTASSASVFLVLKTILQIYSEGAFNDVSKYSQIVSFSLVIAIGLFVLIMAVLEIIKKNHEEEKKPKRLGFWGVVLAVGMVPCHGSMLILIFTNSLGIIGTGFIMILAMSLGMAVTISAAALIAVFIRKGAAGTAGKFTEKTIVFPVIELIGALLIITIGAFFLLGLLG